VGQNYARIPRALGRVSVGTGGAVGGLWLVYNLPNTDFGLNGIWREAINVVILTALQAAG